MASEHESSGVAGGGFVSTGEYTDILFDDYNVPSIPPNFLIAVISMIIRSPESKSVREIICRDSLLERVLFDGSTSSGENSYYRELIVVLVHIIQQAYGIDFRGFGPFSRGVSYDRKKYYELLIKSLSLIWNYSPVLSEGDKLNIIKNVDVDE